jgi:hypothetical protein
MEGRHREPVAAERRHHDGAVVGAARLDLPVRRTTDDRYARRRRADARGQALRVVTDAGEDEQQPGSPFSTASRVACIPASYESVIAEWPTAIQRVVVTVSAPAAVVGRFLFPSTSLSVEPLSDRAARELADPPAHLRSVRPGGGLVLPVGRTGSEWWKFPPPLPPWWDVPGGAAT